MQIRKALEALKDDYQDGLKNSGSEDDMNILDQVEALEVKTNILIPLLSLLKISSVKVARK